MATTNETVRVDDAAQTASAMRLSTIEFYCDLANPSGLVIPIGVMAELMLPTLRGLGMVARTELAKDELRHVGKIGEDIISRPFEYIAKQFEDAWANTAPGDALGYLARRHLYSLHFSDPADLDVPLVLLAGSAGVGLRALARTRLGGGLDEEMLKLLQRYENQPQPQQELFQLKAA